MENLAIWEHGNGWKWTGKNEYGFAHTYRTDKTGQGLFVLQIAVNGSESWQQLQGTSQYSLPRNRSRAIAKIGKRNIATENELSTLKGNF